MRLNLPRGSYTAAPKCLVLPLVSLSRLCESGQQGRSLWAAGPYVEQVVAMEAKAKEIGKGGELYYLFPSGGQTAPGPSMVRSQPFHMKPYE